MPKLLHFILAVTLLTALSVASWKRNAIFADDASLWGDAVTKTPGKSRVYNNLGSGLQKAGRSEEAIAAYQQAVRIDPYNVDAVYGLGIALYSVGRYKEALFQYQQALALDPSKLGPRRNLAMMYFESGMVDQARLEYETIIVMHPGTAEAGFAMNMLSLIAQQASGRR